MTRPLYWCDLLIRDGVSVSNIVSVHIGAGNNKWGVTELRPRWGLEDNWELRLLSWGRAPSSRILQSPETGRADPAWRTRGHLTQEDSILHHIILSRPGLEDARTPYPGGSLLPSSIISSWADLAWRMWGHLTSVSIRDIGILHIILSRDRSYSRYCFYTDTVLKDNDAQ